MQVHLQWKSYHRKNWNLEGGASYNHGCYDPLEQRYNFKFQESHQLGIIVYLGCKNGDKKLIEKSLFVTI